MNPQYTITAQPESEPLTLSEAKAQLRVDSDAEDDYITALISVAREQAEALTGRVCATTGFLLIAPSWAVLCGQEVNPAYYRARDDGELINCITLHRTPLVSVESVSYIPAGETEAVTIDASDYAVVTASEPGLVQMLSALPATADRPDAVQIAFTAGSDGESSTVPATMKHLLRLLVAHYYETRNPVAFATPSEIPMTIRHLVELNRIRGWCA